MDAGTPSVPRELAGGANEQSDQAHRLAAVCCAGEMTQFTTFVTRTGNGRSWSRPEVTPSHPGRSLNSIRRRRLLPIHLGQFHHISAQTQRISKFYRYVNICSQCQLSLFVSSAMKRSKLQPHLKCFPSSGWAEAGTGLSSSSSSGHPPQTCQLGFATYRIGTACGS